MGYIIKKCNKFYLDYALRFGRKNIWTVLPDYFSNTRAEIAQSTNALIHFLCSGKIEMNPDKYIPEKVFIQLFNQHCIDSNYKKCRFNQDFYTGPFSQYSIKVEKNVKKKYLGRMSQTTFYLGIDIKDEHEIINDDDDQL